MAQILQTGHRSEPASRSNIFMDMWALRPHGGPLTLLVVGILLTYLPTLRNGFVDWDDMQNFVDNPWLKSANGTSLKWSLTATHLGVFQPLSWIFIQIQAWLFGVKASVFHGVSVCLHLGIALVLYFFCLDILRHTGATQQLESPRERWLTAAAVLLVMLHPLRVEVVAWSSCQPYLMAIFFALLGFWAYLRATWDDAGHSKKSSRPALLYFCLSCLSKTLILALPVVLLVLDYYPLKRYPKASLRDLAIEKIPYALLSFVTLALGLWAHGIDHPFPTLGELTLMDRLTKVGLAASHYGRTFFSPAQLSAFYPNPPSWKPSFLSILSLGMIASILYGVIKYRQRALGLFSTAIIVGLWLVPHVGIIPTGRVIGADRYTYLATLTLTPLLAYGLTSISRHGRLMSAAMGFVIAATLGFFVMTSRSQLATWENSLTLWTRALHVADQDDAELHFNIAHSLRALGKDQEALSHYQKSLALDANFEKSQLNLGTLYVDLDLPDQAIPLYAKLLEKKPDSAAAHGNLGLAYLAKHDAVLAGKYFEKAHSLEPNDADFAVNLAKYYVLTQRPAKAVDPILHLLKINGPDPETILLLGKIYFETGEFAAADDIWSQGVSLTPVDSPIHQRLECLRTQLLQTQASLGSRIAPDKVRATDSLVTFAPPWSDRYLQKCR